MAGPGAGPLARASPCQGSALASQRPHVVDGADRIRVTFYDGTTVPATLVGADPDSDLAVVQVDLPADQLQPVQVADSTQVKVGELAVAIGNPFGLEGTMTLAARPKSETVQAPPQGQVTGGAYLGIVSHPAPGTILDLCSEQVRL